FKVGDMEPVTFRASFPIQWEHRNNPFGLAVQCLVNLYPHHNRYWHSFAPVCVFPECREEQFPCTRLYSVHKPVKQCISYLCVTSVRRMYIINKEVCSRVVCKEDEVMQDEICRQLAGLPPRRIRRSGQPRGLPCRWGQNKELNKPDAL
uniref:Microfibril associated protein 5 n=1 Tax=Chelydra serpentina TaxID=8475 RepID=A0A8C3TGM2_CHESE